jgi:hypothetical protein
LRDITFRIDDFGRKQRYKVIVYDLRIMSVLYNTGSEIKSLKFEEIPIQHSLYTFGNYFGRIIRIPFYCCTSADPQALKEI